MCGRARCTLNHQQVVRASGYGSAGNSGEPRTVNADRYRPSYNVSPGAYLPTLVVRRGRVEGTETSSEPEPVVHCMKWGLVPSFTKKTEKPDHYRMFNARCESLREKASFCRLIPKNRCVVAVEGFYEWKKDGNKKQPYYVYFKDQRPLVFAALYDSWTNSEGEVLDTFTIITTSSSSPLQWLHDRMPVILKNKSAIDEWLNGSPSKCNSVLEPYKDPDLVWYAVTPAMGKPSFDSAECIKEIQLKNIEKNSITNFFTKKLSASKEQSESRISTMSSPESPDCSQHVKGCASQSDHDVKEEVKPYQDLKAEAESAYCSPEDDKTKVADIHGIKREYAQMNIASKNPTGYSEKMVAVPTSAKKKGKSSKSPGDGQSTLLSFFGKG